LRERWHPAFIRRDFSPSDYCSGDNVASGRFISRHGPVMLRPGAESRNMRILSSVEYLLPFLVWVLVQARTVTQGGFKKRGHVKRLTTALAPVLAPSYHRQAT
jgi:hypothetical protein